MKISLVRSYMHGTSIVGLALPLGAWHSSLPEIMAATGEFFDIVKSVMVRFRFFKSTHLVVPNHSEAIPHYRGTESYQRVGRLYVGMAPTRP